LVIDSDFETSVFKTCRTHLATPLGFDHKNEWRKISMGKRGFLSYGANIGGNFLTTFSEGTGIEKRGKLVLILLRRAASLKKRIDIGSP